MLSDYTSQVSDFLNRFGLYDVTFVNVRTNVNNASTRYEDYFENTYNHLKNTQKFCLKKKITDLYREYNETFMYKNFFDFPSILLREKIAPLLTSPGVDNSAVIFFGDSYTDSTLHNLAALFKYKNEIKPLENRTIIFQDIKLHSTGGDNYNVIEMYYHRRQSLHYLRYQDEQQLMIADNIRLLLETLQWYVQHRDRTSTEYRKILEQVYSDGIHMLESRYTLPLLDWNFETVEMNLKDLTDQYLHKTSFTELKCPTPKCSPGYRPKYGLVR